MTIGEKIRSERRAKGLTQSELAGDKITRNMISAIESGKASMSIDTLKYIASELGVPASYLISEEDDLFFYRKKERMPAIRNALDEKNYTACINLVMKLEKLDDELAYILSECYFMLGISCAKSGFMHSADKYLDMSVHYCDSTLYDTERFRSVIPLYQAIARNVNSPLLEFEDDKYYPIALGVTEFEFYKYLTLDFDFNFLSFQFDRHIKAKQLIKERKYSEAIELLIMIEQQKNDFEYNAYVMFGVYTDLETCYRQLFDFENAYRYASKRISLMEGFKS